jgi:hypothetical protein
MKGLKRVTVAGLLIMGMMSPTLYAAEQRQFTDQDVIKILRAEGYSSIELLEKGAIRIKVDGMTYVLFNREDGDLQAFFGVNQTKISYETINAWNRDTRLSRAYLDRDQDPILEADLLSNGGISSKNITEFFRIFILSSKKYVEHLQGDEKTAQ